MKEEVGEKILSVEKDVLVEDFCPIDKICKLFCIYALYIIYLLLQILCFSTENIGLIQEEMFENFLTVFLRDDVLKSIVGQGRSRL